MCAGAKVVAAAGLLEGRRATTHWYYVRDLLKLSPSTRYVADRRIVADGNVVTTTGITASMPMALTLIEAIAGRPKAETIARGLGLPGWDMRHASAAFRFTRPFATTVLLNSLSVWKHENLGIRLVRNMDEISLGLIADAWSRTYLSNAFTYADELAPVVTANGIRIVPDRRAAQIAIDRRVSTFPDRRPVDALAGALDAITIRYGERTTDVVTMQLEYPRNRSAD